MSDSLETNFCVHWALFDWKWGLSLTELWYEMWRISRWHEKTKKNMQNFVKKKSSEVEFSFFHNKHPFESRTTFFMAFHILGTQN